MNRSTFSYFMFLSWRYIRKNLSRSVYSMLGIMLTVILAFGALTIGYAMFDYQLADMYDTRGVYQLRGGNYMEPPLQYVSHLRQHELVEHVTVGTNVVASEDGVPTEVMYSVYIALKDTSGLAASAEQLRQDLGTADIVPDQWIESYLGQGDSLAGSAKHVVVSLVATLFVAFAMFIIRNTMMSSVLERRGDYGQMRCVGMSARQLYWMLFVEGIILSLAGTVAGVSVCFLVLKSMENWLDDYLQLGGLLQFTCYPSNVALTAVLTVAVTLFALLEPARQAGKATPVESMRNNTESFLSGKRRFKAKRYPLISRLFGVEGEYARKNISRNPVRMFQLFLGIAACTMMMCGVSCFVDSSYATIAKVYRGENIEFPEVVYVDGAYSDEEFQRLEEKISDVEGVEKTGLFLGYLDIFAVRAVPELFSRNVDGITQTAYDKQQFQTLSRYVVEGEISYDRMMEENGVILCDYIYNISDRESDFNYVDRRMTDYKVGDTITEVDPLSYQKCHETYQRLLEESGVEKAYQEIEKAYQESSRYGSISEETEPKTQKEKELLKKKNKAEKNYRKYMRNFLQAVRDAGYPATETASGEEITEKSGTFSVFFAMIYDCYKRGDTNTYTIQAIVSEDIYNSLYGNPDFIHLIYPKDAVLSYVSQDRGEAVSDDFSDDSWRWGVGVLRDVHTLSNDLSQLSDHIHVASMIDPYELEDMRGILHLAETVGYGIAIFIILISMIQIFNTICANLSLRSRELELYRMAGMSKGQERKMILLEHSFVTFFAIILGYLVTRVFSWFFVEKILNQDGSFAYDWNMMKMILLCVMIFGLTLVAGVGGLLHGRRQQK